MRSLRAELQAQSLGKAPEREARVGRAEPLSQEERARSSRLAAELRHAQAKVEKLQGRLGLNIHFNFQRALAVKPAQAAGFAEGARRAIAGS